MRPLLLATATALTSVASTAAPASAQIVIHDSNVPSAPGVYVVNTPPFYSGLSFHNGVITAFPTTPRYGYPPFGYPMPGPFYGYPAYPGQYPFSPGYGSPGAWRP
jgi:hypothetical protein